MSWGYISYSGAKEMIDWVFLPRFYMCFTQHTPPPPPKTHHPVTYTPDWQRVKWIFAHGVGCELKIGKMNIFQIYEHRGTRNLY